MQKQQKLSEPEFDIKLLIQFLNQNLVPMWTNGERQIPQIEINENIRKALAFARRCGSLRVGLDQIKTVLKAEENGLGLMKNSPSGKKLKGMENEASISRLIFVSNDGSERFYRHSETILNLYSHRLLGVKLCVPSSVLGSIYYGKEGKSVKAILVDKKDAVLRILSSIL